jgi:hypothetical protein
MLVVFQNSKALDSRTPFEVFYDAKPNLRGLPEFGCKVWVHTPEGSKLDGRAVEGRWVGFDEDSSGHRIYSPGKRTVSHMAPLEGEKKIVERDPIPLPEKEGRPKRVRTESAAIRRLRTGEGVISDLRKLRTILWLLWLLLVQRLMKSSRHMKRLA